MFVNDNYGSRWVKSLLSWLKNKTLDGCEYNILIRDATLQAGLRRSKTIELINEYIESEFIRIDSGIIYWNDANIQPENMKKETTPIPTPPKEKKRKLRDKPKDDEEIDDNEILATQQKEKYKIYTEECNKAGEQPISYDEWLKKNYGNEPKGRLVK